MAENLGTTICFNASMLSIATEQAHAGQNRVRDATTTMAMDFQNCLTQNRSFDFVLYENGSFQTSRLNTTICTSSGVVATNASTFSGNEQLEHYINGGINFKPTRLTKTSCFIHQGTRHEKAIMAVAMLWTDENRQHRY